jgi:hypothetical protein
MFLIQVSKTHFVDAEKITDLFTEDGYHQYRMTNSEFVKSIHKDYVDIFLNNFNALDDNKALKSHIRERSHS